jgi:cell division protein FtsI/penicillin-binding protein 2
MRAPNTSHALRADLIGSVFAALAFLVVAQAVRLQISPEAPQFIDRNQQLLQVWQIINPPRGEILDRWGNILAGNKTVYEVGAELRDVQNPETIALTLMGILHANYQEVLTAASQPYSLDPKNPHVYALLADFVTEEQKQQIEKIKNDLDTQPAGRSENAKIPSLRGLVLTPHLMRNYPEGAIASNIIGFVSREGKGYFGIEEKFNTQLTGTPLKVLVPLDPNKAKPLPPAPPGDTIILTLSRDLQVSIEQILDDAVKQNDAQGGTIAVMNPRTGEILAMASTPRMDLNQYWTYPDIFKDNTPFNRAVSDTYEPGSVYKVLTMAAALDTKTVKPDTSFLDTGIFEIGGVYIYNWNHAAWGPQDMTGCLEHSLNVCLAWVASKIGPKNFYSYMQAFGIGHPTGIELAGEASGRLKIPGDKDWYDADLGTNAFGQGVSATVVQMLQAVSSVANDGKMVSPHIVRSIVDKGRQYNTQVQVVGSPISANTAHVLTEMLANSLEKESSTALIDGYRVAGKTGTAEIPTPGGYNSDATNASFVGWGPVDDPQFLVYVWIEKPTTSPWGSVVAAPIFRQVVERVVVMTDLPPDDVRLQMKKTAGYDPSKP